MSSTARSIRLQYDVLNDFEPVALLTSNSQMIAGRKGLPANDLKEFIAWLKANPDKATAGTAGVGSPQHVFGVMFQKATGTRFQFSHYRGGVLATQDLMAGQIDLVIADLVTALPQIRGGTVKGFAFTGTSRLPAAPGVPTADEAGLPGFHTSVWNAIWAPKGTPKAYRGAAQRRDCRGLRRSGNAGAARRSRPAARPARPALAGGAARAAQGRNREVVADHQGGEHQERVTPQCAR